MIKVSLIILCGLAAVRLLRSQSAAMRHWVLTIAIACAAAAPLVQPFVPGWDVRPRTGGADTSITSATYTLAPVEGPDKPRAARPLPEISRRPASEAVSRLLGRLWVIGTCMSLIVIVTGLGRLRWIAAHAEQLGEGRWVELAGDIGASYGIRRPVTLLQTDHPTLLVTWGLRRPKIVLPAPAREWTEERMQIVLSHELAHVRRGDWLAQLIAELLRCTYWFNPLVWIAGRRLRQESEQACDDLVLGLGIRGPEYAGHLLDLARTVRNSRQKLFSRLPAPAMARPCSLERRVSAMLNTRMNRAPSSRSARAGAALGLLAMTTLIAGFGANAQSFVTLSGSVLDPNNGLIPGATVSLTNAQSLAKHEVHSDARGEFEFVGLPPGDYRIEARLPGFTTLRENITIPPSDLRRDLSLKIGSLTETVTITSTPGVRAAASRQPPTPDPLPVERIVEECRPSGSGGEIRPPRKIRDANPVYPDNPDGSLQGIVVLEGRVAADGTITQAKALKSPHPELERAALDAFEQWAFTPTLLNCVPVEVSITATMHFTARE